MENKKRLIDANAFIKECDSFIVNPPFAHPAIPWHRGLTLAVKTALLMPTVDAKPVVHGRWVDKREKMWDLERPVVIGCQCSVCGFFGCEEFNYCPNCGAKMDGDGNG